MQVPFNNQDFLPDGAELLEDGYRFPMALGATVYASHGNYAAKSTDQGDTWVDFTKNFGSDVHSVFPATNGYLYVANDNEIWRSTDSGANWTKVEDTSGGYVQPWGWTENSDGDLFFGEYKSAGNVIYVWRSTNAGADWTRLDGLNAESDKHTHVVFVDPETDRLYVSIGDSPKTCFYSDNDGDNWTELFAHSDKGFTGITSTSSARFFGDDRAAGHNRILKTTDDATPTISFIPSWEFNNSYIGIAAIHGTNILLATIWNESQNATQKSSIWKSTDGGDNWTLIASAASGSYKFQRICFDYRHRIPAELGYLICDIVDNERMIRIPL